jgi:fructose-bisphosphate aldolase class I
MDKGDSTCIQRCAAPGVSRVAAAQRTRRESIVTTAGLNESISGAILFEKSGVPTAAPGRSFGPVLNELGTVVSIWPTLAQKRWLGTLARK